MLQANLRISPVILFILLGLLSPLSTTHAAPAKRIVIPIEYHHGFIIITASVNGQSGKYILDSGTPGLVLNQRIFKQGRGSQSELMGIGGKVSSSYYENNRLELGQLQLTISEAYAIDIQYLEKAVQGPVSGLIGLDLFTDFAIRIDYRAKELELSNAKIEMTGLPYIELNVEQYDHLNLVQLNKGDQQIAVILDTGSKDNLINQQLKNTWSASIRQYGAIELLGADQSIQLRDKVKIKGLSIQQQSLSNLLFVTADFTSMSEMLNKQVDGILGQTFLQNFIVVFSRKRNKLRLYYPVPQV